MGMALWVVSACHCDQHSVPTATYDMRSASPALCPAVGILRRGEGVRENRFTLVSRISSQLVLITSYQRAMAAESAATSKTQALGPNLSLYLKEL